VLEQSSNAPVRVPTHRNSQPSVEWCVKTRTTAINVFL
jgi:hypothetical protein